MVVDDVIAGQYPVWSGADGAGVLGGGGAAARHGHRPHRRRLATRRPIRTGSGRFGNAFPVSDGVAGVAVDGRSGGSVEDSV